MGNDTRGERLVANDFQAPLCNHHCAICRDEIEPGAELLCMDCGKHVCSECFDWNMCVKCRGDE